MKLPLVALILTLTGRTVFAASAATGSETLQHPHKRHHHRHHGKGRHQRPHLDGESSAVAASDSHASAVSATASASAVQAVATETHSVSSATAAQTQGKEQTHEHQAPMAGDHTAFPATCSGALQQGRLMVNGPLPADFNERFVHSVAAATSCDPSAVTVIATTDAGDGDVFYVDFSAAASIVHSVENQAADPTSQLANGPFRPFLVADDDGVPASAAPAQLSYEVPVAADATAQTAAVATVPASGQPVADTNCPTCPKTTGLDIDTEMPYGELEPFGREDTAQELSEQSIKESDSMVDQLERAEVAEEKRAVFRALTRLRGAAITSFDGIARSQTGNIDEYNKVHSWRQTHPLNHLADEESDVTKWAFPDNADF